MQLDRVTGGDLVLMTETMNEVDVQEDLSGHLNAVEEEQEEDTMMDSAPSIGASETGESTKRASRKSNLARQHSKSHARGRRSTARHARRSSTRRSCRYSARTSVLATDALEESVEEGEPPVMFGFLHDFVQRRASKIGKEGVLENILDPVLNFFVKDTFEREQLVSDMMDGIITFNKSTENLGPKEKPWPKTSPSTLLKKATEIAKQKTDARCLQAEVHNWLIRYRLLNSYVKEREETTMERRNRMEEFWTLYHTKYKKNELPPISVDTPASPNGRPGTAASRPMSPSAALLGSTKRRTMMAEHGRNITFAQSSMEQAPIQRRTSFLSNNPDVQRSTSRLLQSPVTDEEHWSMIDSIEARLDKERPSPKQPGLKKSASNPEVSGKYGMRWTPDKGFQWQSISPLPGTRAALPDNHFKNPKHQSGHGAGQAAAKKSKGSNSSERLPELESSRPLSADLAATAFESTDKYLEACQRCAVVPMPLPFVTGHSFSLSARGRDMKDADLRAVTVMIRDSLSLGEVDLCANTKLTEKALVPFIHRLFGEPARSTLQRLCLSECKNIGLGTLNMVNRLLSDYDNGVRSLKCLELSRIRITPKTHLDLAKAIHHHPNLEELHLQDTNLGATVLAKTCLEEICSCKRLHFLDLGWNCFDPEEFDHLGACLVEGRRIRTLKLANCSSATGGILNPVTYFLEHLAHDKSLTNLDISINRMDFRSALIIEDSLVRHTQIKELELSENPFGIHGMRSILRLLCQSTCSLAHFECRGCFTGRISRDDPKVPPQVLNNSNPGGRYTLNLEMPYHRSLLRMLYKICEGFKVPQEQAFFDIKWSKGPWSHPTKDHDGIYQVPDGGKLNVTYNIERAIESAVRGVPDDNFSEFLEKHAELIKCTPPFKKAIPLMGCWKLMEGKTTDQTGFLSSLSKDFRLPPAYITQLYKSCSAMRSVTLMSLLSAVAGGMLGRAQCMCLVPTIGEGIRLYETMQNLLDFNPDNPTGHYKLNLESCADYAVGEQLLLLDRWEVVIGKRNNRADTSQHGNNSRFRNETYQGMSLRIEYSNVAEWTMPEADVFEFDYISGKRPPADARLIGEEVFANVLVSLADSECTPVGKIKALRMVSHFFYLNSLQMREMLGAFKEESMRAEAFITLYLRVVDVHNSKVFRVRFADQAELRKLQERLGYVTFFPFIQPENARFELDFQFYDQRLAANLLITLGTKEGSGNIRDYEFTLMDGTKDPLPLGIPRSWEKFSEIPKGGVFKATYTCGPESRKFEARKRLAESWGNYVIDCGGDEVMWWTGLTEPPEDVLDLLEWIIGKYSNPKQAFKAIDGDGGNGVITLREFEESLKELKCTKFEGKDEKERVLKVFRYLDPGGEGSVSEDEWMILDQLWKEYQLSISEFVHYLQRQFGDNLADAWAFLDDDDSGELTLDEWVQAVESIGFFGPSKVVFGLIDNSDDGSISIDEFEVLEAYKKKPKE